MRRALLIIGCCGLLWAGTEASGQDLKVGDPAPKLQIAEWLKGQPVDLQAGKGKHVYLLEFWATWCPPCIDSMPHLSKLQKKYKDKGLVVIGITDEPKNVVAPFMKRMDSKIGYTVASDALTSTPMGPVGKTYQSYMVSSGQQGIPTSFIITKEGQIAWIGSPFIGMDEVLASVLEGSFDIELAKADEQFARRHMMDLLAATQQGNWQKVVEIGRHIADPKTKISQSLRTQMLNGISWELLTSHMADKKNFKEALYFAKAAYDFCEGNDVSVIDTYARALFETGQVAEAVDYQTRAVDLSEGPMKTELQRTLDEYKKSLRQAGS